LRRLSPLTECVVMTEERRRRDASPETARAEQTCDRVFVHDLVLDVEIGVYTHEKGVTQRVRFSVDLDVLPATAAIEDNIERVLDYDMIIGAIKSIVASGHIHLAETLAEEVAAWCLAHPRADRAFVKIEKLDKEPGAVGVEIVRTRPGRER
jgi:dihydroneopterin aldolase